MRTRRTCSNCREHEPFTLDLESTSPLQGELTLDPENTSRGRTHFRTHSKYLEQTMGKLTLDPKSTNRGRMTRSKSHSGSQGRTCSRFRSKSCFRDSRYRYRSRSHSRSRSRSPSKSHHRDSRSRSCFRSHSRSRSTSRSRDFRSRSCSRSYFRSCSRSHSKFRSRSRSRSHSKSCSRSHSKSRPRDSHSRSCSRDFRSRSRSRSHSRSRSRSRSRSHSKSRPHDSRSRSCSKSRSRDFRSRSRSRSHSRSCSRSCSKSRPRDSHSRSRSKSRSRDFRSRSRSRSHSRSCSKSRSRDFCSRSRSKSHSQDFHYGSRSRSHFRSRSKSLSRDSRSRSRSRDSRSRSRFRSRSQDSRSRSRSRSHFRSCSRSRGGTYSKYLKHKNYPKYKFELMNHQKPYFCDGCKERGYGSRYRCVRYNVELHEECMFPSYKTSHECFPGCTFTFLKQTPGRDERYCDACGMAVKGFVYHCKRAGKDLHPCCRCLKNKIEIDGVGLQLCNNKVPKKKCSFCKKKKLPNGVPGIPGWSYVSKTKSDNYHFHVHCTMEWVIDSWKNIGPQDNNHLTLENLALTELKADSIERD